MKTNSLPIVLALSVSLSSCGGSPAASSPPDPHNPSTYSGNYYYAEVTGAADPFSLPLLPPNVWNQVQWNSIALLYHTRSGTWTVAMNQPDYYPNSAQPVLMGPFTGTWTGTPEHTFQYRGTSVNWNTGLAGNANPVNGGVPYDIFQPAAALDWTVMPPDGSINLCSVSTNAVYTNDLGGGSISCAIEVMDVTTREVNATTVNLRVIKDRAY